MALVTANPLEDITGSPAARAVDSVKTYGKGEAIVTELVGVNVEFSCQVLR
jgi:hypothetical protein